MAFERVYTVWDFYDGPRAGIASYLGKPHYYTCEWDEGADDYAKTLLLKPIDDQTLSLVLDQWVIWLKWEREFQSGQRAIETHPRLGGQDERYNELDAKIKAGLETPTQSLRVRGTFRVASGHTATESPIVDFEVEWVHGT